MIGAGHTLGRSVSTSTLMRPGKGRLAKMNHHLEADVDPVGARERQPSPDIWPGRYHCRSFRALEKLPSN
jgi:hypothetical protein